MSISTAPSAPAERRRAIRVPEYLRERPALGAAIVYALLALIMVGQGLLPGRTFTASDLLYGQVPWLSSKPAGAQPGPSNFELADAAQQFQPFLTYSRDRLLDAPLWNPYVNGGRPFIGNAQSAVFSPFSVPSYVLPFWKSLAVVAFIKLFLAAFGTYLLSRRLGMRFGGALLSGVVFAFGTFFIVWLAWPLTSIFCLIPWLLLCTDILIRRPGPLPVAAVAALVWAVLVGGHPESSFHVLFVAGVWFLFRLWLHWREAGAPARETVVRPLLAFTGAAFLGLGLAMIALAPFLELLFHSGDLERRLGDTEASFWPKRYVGGLFLHDYWGRPTQTDIDAFMVIRGWYAGALTLMLVAAALILRRLNATVVALVVFAFFCACMVVGIEPVFTLVEKLPGFSTAHNERMLIFILFCLGLLSGFGLDALSARERPSPGRRKALIAVAAGIFMVPIVWMAAAGTLTTDHLGDALRVAWGFEDPPKVLSETTGTIVRSSALLMWLPLAGAGLALVVWRLRGGDKHRLAAGAFVALAVLLVAADLFRANLGFNPSIPTETATQPATGSIKYLQTRRPNRFAGIGTAQFAQPLSPNTSIYYGLYDARGYDYPVEKHVDKLWRRSIAPTIGDFTQPVTFADRTPASIHALGLLSVSDLLVDPRDPPLRVPGLRVVYRGPDALVYANDRALPRALLVDRQRVVASDDAALAAVTAPSFDGRRVAITQKPLAGIPQAGAAGGGAQAPGTAELSLDGDERLSVTTNAPRRSLLVLTDIDYPGWKATVDSKPAEIERVDYLLRGVVVPPGSHRVEMRYEPTSWRVGWIVSAISLAILAALVVAGVVRRRRES
jgi:Bacterial membrane protein YfhO